jgi:hypothetical protein
MNELSNSEKTKLSIEAIAQFLDQFQPIDEKTIAFINVLFDILYASKMGSNFNK